MALEFYQHPELYDALLPAGAHLPFYLDLAKEHPEGVLELACGTGQLAVPIAADGISTFGLDQSATMLNAARTRAAASGVTVDLVEGDMRNFEFVRRFGLIFIARNSLLHLLSVQDLVATFAAVRRNLAPGGVFAFDVFTPDVKLLAREAGQRFPVMTVDTAAFGKLVVEGSQHYDAAEQVVRARWYISAADQPDKWVVPIVVRVIFPQELPLLIEAGGLRLVDRFGDLSKQPFGPVSKHQVCFCDAPP
jgi:SAM-dependent methyltransferase